MPDLPYLIVSPNPIGRGWMTLAAAADAETAKVIARALEERDGKPRDSYRVRVNKGDGE